MTLCSNVGRCKQTCSGYGWSGDLLTRRPGHCFHGLIIAKGSMYSLVCIVGIDPSDGISKVLIVG